MNTDIDFLINFFNKHTRSEFKDEMGEQEAEAPAAGGGGGKSLSGQIHIQLPEVKQIC